MTVSYALLFCVGPLMPEQPNERWYCVLFPVSNPRVGLQGGPRNPFGGVTTGVTSGVPQASKQGPDPRFSRKALSSSGGTKKGKILVVFFGLTSFRRVWFRPENGTFLQILGVPTGEKTRRNEENTRKRRSSEVGHESFFLRGNAQNL